MKLSRDCCIFRYPEILEEDDLYNVASGVVDAALENRANYVAATGSVL